MNFNVEGNLDKSVLPEIKNIVKDAIKEETIQRNRNLNKNGIFRGVK
jgi:hypothetical protein